MRKKNITNIILFATLFFQANILAKTKINPERLSLKFDRVLAAMLQKTQAKIAPWNNSTCGMFAEKIIENVEAMKKPFAQIAYAFTQNEFVPYKKLNAALSNLYKTVIATEKKLVAIGPWDVRWLINATRVLEVEAKKTPGNFGAILQMTTIFHHNIAPHFAMHIGTGFEKMFDKVVRRPSEWYLRNWWWTIPVTAGSIFALYKTSDDIKKLLGFATVTGGAITVTPDPDPDPRPRPRPRPRPVPEPNPNYESLAESFLQGYNINLNDIEPGRTIQVGDNIHMRVYPNNFAVIQFPSHQQPDGVQCGIYTITNLFPLSSNNINQTVTNGMMHGNNDAYLRRVRQMFARERANGPRGDDVDLRLDNGEVARILANNRQWNSIHNMMIPYVDPDDEFADEEEDFAYRGQYHCQQLNNMTIRIIDLENDFARVGVADRMRNNNLTLPELLDARNEFTQRRQQNQFYSELLAVVFHNHWMAVRMEILPNGWTVLFFGDSLRNNNGNSINHYRVLWNHIALASGLNQNDNGEDNFDF